MSQDCVRNSKNCKLSHKKYSLRESNRWSPFVDMFLIYISHIFFWYFLSYARLLRLSRSRRTANRCSISMSSSTTRKSSKKECLCISGMNGSGINWELLSRISRPSINWNAEDKLLKLMYDSKYRITLSLAQIIDFYFFFYVWSSPEFYPFILSFIFIFIFHFYFYLLSLLDLYLYCSWVSLFFLLDQF